MMFGFPEIFALFMLNPTPVSLRFGKNLHPVPHDAIGIPAIEAIDFLHDIQVLQLVPIGLDVFPAFHIRDPVEGKTDPVIQLHPEIH